MKPIIVGLYNPYSDQVNDALVPYPDASAGGRLFSMLNKIDISYLDHRAFNASAHKSVYVQRLDRRNLCHELHGGRTQRLFARMAANEMLLTFPDGATVILLGREVFSAFNSCLGNQLQLTLIHPQVADGITWRWLPHPSGRSQIYNSPVMRTLAGLLLADVISAAPGEQ